MGDVVCEPRESNNSLTASRRSPSAFRRIQNALFSNGLAEYIRGSPKKKEDSVQPPESNNNENILKLESMGLCGTATPTKATNIGSAEALKVPSPSPSVAAKRAPRYALEPNNKDWTISDYDSAEVLEIPEPKMNQNIRILDCKNITVKISKKVNNVVLEHCEKVAVVINSVISSIEVIHTKDSKLQVLGTASALVLDNADGINVYASYESRCIQISTSQISEINFHVPETPESDEWVEIPIPAQFIHQLAEGSNTLNSKVSDLYH